MRPSSPCPLKKVKLRMPVVDSLYWELPELGAKERNQQESAHNNNNNNIRDNPLQKSTTLRVQVMNM